VDEDSEEQIDEDLLDAQREAIARIQVDEAARILADAILLDRTDRPRAVMRD
jgi:carboxyl-terminal processing protease